MPKICNFCDPPKVIDADPVDSDIPGICQDCYRKLTIEQELPEVDIPERLGKCNILKVHGDGDLTVACGGKKWIVTKEGETYSEDLGQLPNGTLALTPEEEMQV